jgi:photosystem II stability/assembly factor-like uncharacterized protein
MTERTQYAFNQLFSIDPERTRGAGEGEADRELEAEVVLNSILTTSREENNTANWSNYAVDFKMKRTRAGWIVPAVLGVAIVVIAAFVIAPSSAVSKRTTTVPARRTPSQTPVEMGWRLVSEVDTGVHSFSGSGASPGGLQDLTCPTARACYLGSATGGGLPSNVAYRSTDGGATWQEIKLPSGLFQDTPFSCFNATSCMVGAEAGFGSGVGGSNVPQVLLSTTDGGATWTSRHVPMPPITGTDAALNQAISGLQGHLDQVFCFSATTCVVFGTTPTGEPEGGSNGTNFVSETVAMRTDDSGVTWTSHIFPWSPTPSGSPGWSNEEHATFSCPTQDSCIGLATVSGAPDLTPAARSAGTYGNQPSTLLEIRMTSGGSAWRQQWILGLDGGNILTCSDQLHCMANGVGTASDPTGVLTTSDGGGTWTAQPVFPSANPNWDSVDSISCATSTTCWIAGAGQSPTNGTQPLGVIFLTQNGGRTWLPVQLPSGLGGVSRIDCNSDSSCLAIARPLLSGPETGGTHVPTLVLSNASGS